MPTPPGPRRGKRIALTLVGAALALLTLAFFVAPVVAARVLRARLVEALGERTGGSASLEALSLSWGGHVGATELVLVDDAGRRVLALHRLDARVALLPALRGDVWARARCDGFELALRRDAGRTGGSGGAPGSDTPTPDAPPLPRIDVELELRDGRVVLEDTDGTGTLEGVTLDLELETERETVGSLEQALLGGALRGRLTVAHLQLETPALAGEGRAAASLEGGRVELELDLDANDGTLAARASIPLAPDPDAPATLAWRADGVRATAPMAPLLARVHPLLVGVEGLAQGQLRGRLRSELELAYRAPLLPTLMDGTWSDLPPTALDAQGTLALDQAMLADSELLAQVVALLGGDAGAPLDLDPVHLRVEAGRLRYEEPWTWKVAGARTSFTGSIGVDGGLDLVWNVPVDERLARRHHLPAELVGHALAVPLRGTLRHPKLDVEGALGAFAREAVGDAVQDAVQKELGRLEERLEKQLGERVDLGRLLGRPKPVEREDASGDGDGDGR